MNLIHKISGRLRRLLIAALVIAAALHLTGCNDEAFVYEIRPDLNDISVDETGDTLTVNFQTDDWNISSIWNNGRPIADNSSLSGLGQLFYSGLTLKFKIIREARYSLRLAIAPNFSQQKNDMIIYFSNSVETDSMTVHQEASAGYTLENVVWDTSPVTDFIDHYVKGWSHAVDNSDGTEPVIYRAGTYKGIRRTVNFEDTCALYLHKSFKVKIPKGVLDDGKPVMGDDEVEYTPSLQEIGFDDEDDETVITFPAGESKEYCVLWCIKEINFRYRLYLRSLNSGKIVTVPGTMTSMTPCDAWKYWKE